MRRPYPYGVAHRRARTEALARLARDVAAVCPRCGELMTPGMALDMGHPDRPGGYGLEHRKCNRSAGGSKGRAVQLARKPPRPARRPARPPASSGGWVW